MMMQIVLMVLMMFFYYSFDSDYFYVDIYNDIYNNGYDNVSGYDDEGIDEGEIKVIISKYKRHF